MGSPLVAITNNWLLGKALERMVRWVLGSPFELLYLTYERVPSLLTVELLDQAMLVMLELNRSYPEGDRAEGAAVAGVLAAQGKRFLVISPESWSREILSPTFWDPSAADELSERVLMLLNSEPNYSEEAARLQARFEALLTLPIPHP